MTQSITADDAVFNGKPMPDDEHAGMGGAMIWRLITMFDATARSIPTSEPENEKDSEKEKAPATPETDSPAGFDEEEKELLTAFQGLPSDGKQALLHLNQAQLALQEAVGHARKAADGRPWIAGRLATEFRKDADDLDVLGATPHPDALVLAAWSEYVRVSTAFDALPLTISDEEAEPLACELDACRDRMEGIPATTLEGVLLKLRYLFAALMESQDAIDAAIYGKPASAALLHTLSLDCRERMLWNMIQPVPLATAANDHQTKVDAFADSVAAFEAEAPVTLALPLEPTGRMIEAGATAAGITPEQFQAAYAAAMDALKLERVA
ncbi:hypothetical protein J2847_006739 [Azospirillum agricola]|uniref:hypothetical protein n=1 Tax=Azospirillum agricola TaxID=1720247 RepID=UPI001AE88D9D|nr:hypothetical protein [Azospirillum agricola]MBP2233401.1 hypothetical protein [Azospirillum agricola]